MNAFRWTLAIALCAAGGYGIHLNRLVPEQASPAAETAVDGGGPTVDLSAADRDQEERALRERFELYRKLRLQDDVVALYDLTDPEQRTRIDLRSFLSYYGHGMVRFDGIQLDSIEIDWERGEAIVTATTSAELLVDKLPRNYKLSMKQGADDTRIEAPNAYSWVRRGDGQWYFRMDQQIVNGQTADGRGVQPAADQGGGSFSEEESPR